MGSPADSTPTVHQGEIRLLVVGDPDARQTVGGGSHAGLVESLPIIERTVADLGLSDSVNDLRERIAASPLEATQFIQVVVEASSPEGALALANTLGSNYISWYSAQDLPGTVSIVEPARLVDVNELASTGIEPVALAIVALFGLAAASGAVLLLDYLRNVVKSVKDIEAAGGTPVLATLPVWPGDKGTEPRLTKGMTDRRDVAERYRMLRTAFDLTGPGKTATTVLVTAGSPGEGATTTAANFAVALAQTERRVLLLDTNLRAPAVHVLFGLGNEQGLSQALEANRPAVLPCLRDTNFENLTVMSSGPVPPNPSELLSSARFDELLAELTVQFDTVVLDGPSVLDVTDSTILAAKADATMVVVRAETTRIPQLEVTVKALGSGPSNILGFVLNRDESDLRFPFLGITSSPKAAKDDSQEPELRSAAPTAG
jgi:capsular exopolysaccharide synthesis family protein